MVADSCPPACLQYPHVLVQAPPVTEEIRAHAMAVVVPGGLDPMAPDVEARLAALSLPQLLKARIILPWALVAAFVSLAG